jgi:predicted AAA+ superfamily ATPase
MTKLASPFSTGSGGPDFERRVGAYFLATVLLRAVPRGQEAGIAREARFQQLYDNEPLDDLVVFSDLPVGETKLTLPKFPLQIETAKTALQIKRDLVFGEKDKTFDEVIRACWETLKSPKFNLGIDRFGIVIGLYSKKIDEHYQSVLRWAQNSANAAAFLSRVSQERLSNKTQADFVQLIKTKLDRYQGSSVNDDDIWNFLRSMVILHFDFHTGSSRDYAYIIEMLSHLLPPEKKTEAPHLFSALCDYAADTNRTAGNFDSVNLRQKLQFSFALLPAPDCRTDLKRLREHADFVLRDIRTDIGGFVLNRSSVVADAREMMQKTPLLELVGSPGAGKSAVLKALIESQRGEGFVIVLAWDRISGTDWNSFASTLQLTQPLNQLLLAVSSSSQPSIFIDGVDRIIDKGKQNVVNDLLRSLANVPLSQDGSRHWTVVISVREENRAELYKWLDWRVLGKPEMLLIPELKEEELESIAEHSPRLKPLLTLSQLEPIVKNPFMLSLLEDQRMLPDAEVLPPIATEIEVSQIWWENLVGQDGVLGRTRQQSLLNLGEQAVESPGRRLLGKDISSEALLSLESDRILLRVRGRDVYRFSHDLLEDWVLCRVLDQYREDLALYLQKWGQPFGLFRTVQLLGASLLEEEETAEAWMQLIEQIEQATELSPRWRQALLTAPLVSPRARDLLDKAEPLLVRDDARRLTELLVALRTVEVSPNFSRLPFLKDPNKPLDELIPILLSDPVPRWQVWLPLMGWLLPRLNNLPATVRPEAAKLMEMWQLKTPDRAIYRQEIGEIALTWLEQVQRRNNHVEI